MGKKNRNSSSQPTSTSLENSVSENEQVIDTGAEEQLDQAEQAAPADQVETPAAEATTEQPQTETPTEAAPEPTPEAAPEQAVEEVVKAPVVEETATEPEPEAAAPVAAKERSLYDLAVEEVLANLSDEVRSHVVNILESDDQLAVLTMRDIIAYARNMAPNTPVSEQSGGLYQVSLYRALINIFNNGCKNFRLFYSVFLAMVAELKKEHAFNERFVNRFHPTMPLGTEDRQAFLNLTHLILTTADAASRSAVLTQVDLGRALAKGLNEAGRKRLTNVYTA